MSWVVDQLSELGHHGGKTRKYSLEYVFFFLVKLRSQSQVGSDWNLVEGLKNPKRSFKELDWLWIFNLVNFIGIKEPVLTIW